MRVSDLLKKADGILGTTYLQRVEITRINDDKTNSLLDINIEKAMAGDIDHDVLFCSQEMILLYMTCNL